MDLTLAIITFGLVLTGAVFIGYPLGTIIGRGNTQREYQNKYILLPKTNCFPNRWLQSAENSEAKQWD